jgi:type VII secretion integral membrane protein EccD
VLLAAACAAAGRLGAERGTVLTAGLSAMAMAGLAGLAFRAGPGGGFDPGVPGVLVSAGCVAVTAGALALTAMPFLLPGTAIVTAGAAAAVVALRSAFDWSSGQAVAVVAVALFLLCHFAPRLTLRVARLRVPQLPHNAEELQQDIDPQPQERVEHNVGAAIAYLDSLSLGFALFYFVAFWFMTREHGWIGWALPLVFAAVILLTSRGQTGILQRVPNVIVGTAGLAILLLQQLATNGAGQRGTVAAILALAALSLLVAAWRPPTTRVLPVWGHICDICEMFAALSLLPLLLQLLHVYSHLRELAS